VNPVLQDIRLVVVRWDALRKAYGDVLRCAYRLAMAARQVPPLTNNQLCNAKRVTLAIPEALFSTALLGPFRVARSSLRAAMRGEERRIAALSHGLPSYLSIAYWQTVRATMLLARTGLPTEYRRRADFVRACNAHLTALAPRSLTHHARWLWDTSHGKTAVLVPSLERSGAVWTIPALLAALKSDHTDKWRRGKLRSQLRRLATVRQIAAWEREGVLGKLCRPLTPRQRELSRKRTLARCRKREQDPKRRAYMRRYMKEYRRAQ
jgi:hypothetical protein